MDFTTKLPSDIITQIFSFYPTSRPSWFLAPILTCKNLHRIVTPILYSHITLTVTTYPPGFNRRVWESLCLARNTEKLAKYTRILTIMSAEWWIDQDGLQEFNMQSSDLMDIGGRLVKFCQKFPEGAIQEVYVGSLQLALTLPAHLLSVTKYVSAKLSGLNFIETLTKSQSSPLSSLTTITLDKIDVSYKSIGYSWKFLESVNNTLTHLRFKADVSMKKRYFDHGRIRYLEGETCPPILHPDTFTDKSSGGNLTCVTKVEMEHLIFLDELILQFENLLDWENVQAFKMWKCEAAEKFTVHVTGRMPNLTDLDLDISHTEKNVIDDVLDGLKCNGLKSLRITCLALKEKGVLRKGVMRHRETLKRLWIECNAGGYTLEMPVQTRKRKPRRKVPVHDDAGDEELTLEMLAEFPLLEHLAIALEKFEDKEVAPVVSKINDDRRLKPQF
ncbi:hypothetical protein TWF694_004582 [Orbilia ellipsospora]|uniref:F-box domain-containing protein n=1 Tax=Orbilia ellipsospora TaxID=2528407 RepID=A0AAV9WY54_9PEZI